MAKYWISTVSKQHVQNGVLQSFCQVCHGKSILKKMNKGDWLVYYSPRETMEKSSKVLKSFTAIGQMSDENVYQFKMSDSFIPFRRNVNYLQDIKDTPIQPLLSELSFTKDRKSRWGAMFRTGLFEITQADFNLIKSKMILNNDNKDNNINNNLDTSSNSTDKDKNLEIENERVLKKQKV